MKTFAVAFSLLLVMACSRHSAPTGPVRHYALTGKIVALDEKHQTATIDAAAIPNYMEAMTMDYPIESKDDFRALKVGENITGTLDVASDETYTLTHIKPAP
ncbi:MAG TPA: copper-binding protein [Bryobacteraceae bacterium]|nr:copper-binding protein [Bryobacteraceae bacterium]